jgi:hypothetical protein
VEGTGEPRSRASAGSRWWRYALLVPLVLAVVMFLLLQDLWTLLVGGGVTLVATLTVSVLAAKQRH